MRAQASVRPPPLRLTVGQWGNLDEDIEGELVQGRLEEEELPTHIHELVVIWFAVWLKLWAKPRGGAVGGSETKVAIGPRRGRKPDLAVFSKQALPGGRDSLVRVAPWIVLEVLSPRPRDERRDRVEKPRDYARCGARYYWIVNPTLRTLEISELNSRGRYELVLSASGGPQRRIPGCPGLKLDLEDLWAEVAAAERR